MAEMIKVKAELIYYSPSGGQMKQNDTTRSAVKKVSTNEKKRRNNVEWVGLKAGLINYVRNSAPPN